MLRHPPTDRCAVHAGDFGSFGHETRLDRLPPVQVLVQGSIQVAICSDRMLHPLFDFLPKYFLRSGWESRQMKRVGNSPELLTGLPTVFRFKRLELKTLQRTSNSSDECEEHTGTGQSRWVPDSPP